VEMDLKTPQPFKMFFSIPLNPIDVKNFWDKNVKEIQQ